MKRNILAALALVALFASACPVGACSLCGLAGIKDQRTFREDMAQAKVILYGRVANPRFIDDRLGTGISDFHTLSVLKDDGRGQHKLLQLDRYIPVLDEKNPPLLVLFCDVVDNKLDPYRGRTVQSSAVLRYVADIGTLKNQSRAAQLQFYFRHLGHTDETIAEDAFLEFARSSDREVGEVAASLAPERLRKLLLDPKTPVGHLSLFAFLLGGCGTAGDADLLRKLIDNPTSDTDSNLDGLLSGYINLRPRDGWDLAYAILADRERPFLQQFAAVRTLRFYQGWKPEETRKEVLRCHAQVVSDGEIADLAIEDLRRWKMWELTSVLLAQFGRDSHKAPITRRAIVRYALSCPHPEARAFIQQLEAQPEHRELVRELRESLATEKE